MIRKKLSWHLAVSWVTRFRLNCLVQFSYETRWWGHRITDGLRWLSSAYIPFRTLLVGTHVDTEDRGIEQWREGKPRLRAGRYDTHFPRSHHQLLFSLPVTSGSSLDSYLGLRDMKQSRMALSLLSRARLLPEVFLFLHFTSLQLTPAT